MMPKLQLLDNQQCRAGGLGTSVPVILANSWQRLPTRFAALSNQGMHTKSQ
jgi:hypothetical protein